MSYRSNHVINISKVGGEWRQNLCLLLPPLCQAVNASLTELRRGFLLPPPAMATFCMCSSSLSPKQKRSCNRSRGHHELGWGIHRSFVAILRMSTVFTAPTTPFPSFNSLPPLDLTASHGEWGSRPLQACRRCCGCCCRCRFSWDAGCRPTRRATGSASCPASPPSPSRSTPATSPSIPAAAAPSSTGSSRPRPLPSLPPSCSGSTAAPDARPSATALPRRSGPFASAPMAGLLTSILTLGIMVIMFVRLIDWSVEFRFWFVPRTGGWFCSGELVVLGVSCGRRLLVLQYIHGSVHCWWHEDRLWLHNGVILLVTNNLGLFDFKFLDLCH